MVLLKVEVSQALLPPVQQSHGFVNPVKGMLIIQPANSAQIQVNSVVIE